MLKRLHNVPISATLTGLFCERFTDVLSVVLLIVIGLFSLAQGREVVIAVGIAQVAFLIMIQRPEFVKTRLLGPLGRWPRLQKLVGKMEHVLDITHLLLKPRVLVGSTLLAAGAWGLEGVALYFIFQGLGVESISLYQAVLIYCAGGLVGALSFLPGGIGGHEAVSISLSMLYGASQGAAVVATLLIRLTTIWFAVGIGIIALVRIKKA